jgi:CBS domain containing-hemolysin-like protein
MAVQLGEREYVFDAQIRLDEVSKVLGVELPSDESDTLGGFIYSQLGSVPSTGSRVVFERLSLEVLSITGRRIQQVKVTRQLPLEPTTKHEPQLKSTSVPASSAT